MEYWGYLVGVLPYLVAAGLGLAFPLLLVATYNHFGAGLAVVAVTFVAETLNLSQPLLRVGITIYVPDIPMLLLGMAAALRWMIRSDVPRRHWAWVLLALVFIADLAIGLARNGTAAGVQGRGAFYAIAAGTYAMSFPITRARIRQLAQGLTAVAAALVLVCVYRWVVYYAPIPELLPPGGAYNIDGAVRVVGANVALVIADVLVIGLFFGRARLGSTTSRWLVPLTLAAVLVLQHRSVWLAAIVGVLLSLLLARSQRVPVWQQILVTAMVAVTVASPAFFGGPLSEQLQSSAARAVSGEGTVDARFANWRSTINQWWADGPKAIAVGRELGSDTTRLIHADSGTVRISFSAHNHFVDVLTSMGVLGLLGTLVVFAYVALGLLRQCRAHDDDSPFSALLLVLFGMQIAFYVAYTVDYLQYLTLGMTVAWVAAHEKSRRGAADGPVTEPMLPHLQRGAWRA